jgi:hypothetical protein
MTAWHAVQQQEPSIAPDAIKRGNTANETFIYNQKQAYRHYTDQLFNGAGWQLIRRKRTSVTAVLWHTVA